MTAGKVEIRTEGRLIRIARIHGDKYRSVENPESILDGLRKAADRVDLFTFVQMLPETVPKYQYPLEWDNFAALEVSTFEHWWTNQIGFKARNKAKQAEKRGVVVREVGFEESLVRGIREIYNECPVRQGRRFPHYGKDFDTVRKEAATFLDSSVFIGAFFEDKLIGFAKLTINQTCQQAGLMQIVSMILHRDKAPTNALIAQSVRSCANRRIPYLVYSNFAYGKKQHDSLSDFKERNAFHKIDVPRYYIPLTPIGRIALRLDLHHNILDYFPEALTSRLRKARHAWNARRFQTAAELS